MRTRSKRMRSWRAPAERRRPLAVSTVIFALRPPDDDRRIRSGSRSCAAPATRRRTCGRCPAAGFPPTRTWCRGRPHPRRDHGDSPRASSSSSTPSAPSTAPPRRVVSIVYWALVRSDEVDAAAVGENVRWFDADDLPAARLRPQRDRRLRPLAAAQQGRLQPHRARPPRRRVHARRAARGATRRSSAAASTRRTSAARSRTPATSSPPTASARAATARRACTATTRTSSSPIAARSSDTDPERIEHVMTATSITLEPRARRTRPSTTRSRRSSAGASTAETCNTDLAAGPWNFDAGAPATAPARRWAT